MQHPAAFGLTCKDALTVFSQYETLRLQKRVTELEKTSYVDVKLSRPFKAEVVAKNIKDRFDAKNDPLQREAPVRFDDFLYNSHSYNSMFSMPWRCMTHDPLLEIISSELQKCIMKAPSKKTCENWAMAQTDKILNSVLSVFRGAYHMAFIHDSHKILETDKELQESLFWEAMYHSIVYSDIFDDYCMYDTDESDEEKGVI